MKKLKQRPPTLGDIERGVYSKKKLAPYQKEFKKLQEVMRRNIVNMQEAMRQSVEASTTALNKTIQDVLEPIYRDSDRAKRLIEFLDSIDDDEGSNTAFQKIQNEIDAKGALTAQQIIYLIWEARGVDVSAEIKKMAEKGKRFTDNKRGLSCLYRKVFDILKKSGAKTSADDIWKELGLLTNDKVIQEVTEDCVYWRGDNGNERETKRSTVNNRLGSLRKLVK
ncbi:MAG: hypothetical protein HY016_08280 [Nitrosomonadales bacterium]|nr:hypothetical protein [Nitrosomonadales bacterium]